MQQKNWLLLNRLILTTPKNSIEILMQQIEPENSEKIE